MRITRFLQTCRSVRSFSHIRSLLSKEKNVVCSIDAIHSNRSSSTLSHQPGEWNTGLKMPDPQYDWKYLCKEENLKEIQENIKNRKGVGDIHKVVELWKQWKNETEGEKKMKLLTELNYAASEIPNRSCPSSPIGEEDNATLIEEVGDKREFDFTPKTVIDVTENLGLVRTKSLNAALGHRAYYFLGDLAQMEQALIKYTVQKLTKLGFTLISVPDIIHPAIVEACGFKTSGEKNQVYKLDKDQHSALCLAGTSEMPIAGFLMNEVFLEQDLPQRLCAVSRCYRAEASGADEEQGIYRVHQFTKVEMFGVTTPDHSQQLLDEFIEIEKQLFSELGLHFRVLDMPTHELGAPAYKKYDIEAWMPAKEFWGEISSASNCTDFQSRRLSMKYSSQDGVDKHVHTINGTACAIPRLIMAIVENYQQADGSVVIPESLRSLMGNKNKLLHLNINDHMKFSDKHVDKLKKLTSLG